MKRRYLLALSLGLMMPSQVSAEPMPMEYVRICDRYGAGYYYNPGTETCINTATGKTLTETEQGTAQGETELASRMSDIERRISGAFGDDAAVAAALADPDLVAGEQFGIRVNWGQ